jgi:glycosyltransferase involved in cell wall biosynthesis
MKYSIIVPVFNRPDEVDELLESLCRQTVKDDFEVLIVEDGSQRDCKAVVDKYTDRLDVQYFKKPNSGPGQSRNYGAERARGQWLLILDSDVVLPESYLESIERSIDPQLAAFGGPDAAHPSFTPVQKAISYSMTSFFTTGGIRGGKAKLDKFYPRSFNMGIRRDVYLHLGGFSKMRFGEDIDFSYRIVEAGYPTQLFPEAWVWHKRRTDFRKFFRQVYNSGIARINLAKRHPGTLKLVHLLPTVFTLGVILLVLAFVCGLMLSSFGTPEVKLQGQLICRLSLLPLALYALLIFVDSSIRNHSLHVGLLSVPAAFVQLTGYGLGFIESWWKRCILRQDEFQAFEKTFYK